MLFCIFQLPQLFFLYESCSRIYLKNNLQFKCFSVFCHFKAKIHTWYPCYSLAFSLLPHYYFTLPYVTPLALYCSETTARVSLYKVCHCISYPHKVTPCPLCVEVLDLLPCESNKLRIPYFSLLHFQKL